MREDSAAELVARFLRMNGYNETLDAFIKEAGLRNNAGSTSSKGALTIEQVLEEKKVFDTTVAFEKVGVEDEKKSWTRPAPSSADVIETLTGTSNILHAKIGQIRGDGAPSNTKFILATAADKSTSILSTKAPYRQIEQLNLPLSDSPVLSSTVILDRYVITTSMAGATLLYDTVTRSTLDLRRDHMKYAVQVTAKTEADRIWVATAAWDAKVLLYSVERSTSDDIKLGAPVGVVKLTSNPEALCFIDHPEIATPVLVVTRRDSTFLYYYAIPEAITSGTLSEPQHLTLLGRQNLAPHSNAWVAFTPSAVALSPLDPSIIAVATSAVPHMKLIIVRLLLPPPIDPAAETQTSVFSAIPTDTNGRAGLATPAEAAHAAQARAALAVQDREDAAILVNCTTMAPQTPYSTPGLAWRPDGTGIWVTGDDGAVRGIEANTGKVVVTLVNGGHEAGTKVRCLSAGTVETENGLEEVVISGGFDRRLIVWRV